VSETIADMLRRLSLPAHGALELLLGLALIAAPFVLGFAPAGVIACAAAGALLAGLGLSAEMPVSAHMTADTAVAMAMLAGAVGVSATDSVAGGLLAAAAACELALGACTCWTRRV
jgi:hypothetical protein